MQHHMPAIATPNRELVRTQAAAAAINEAKKCLSASAIASLRHSDVNVERVYRTDAKINSTPPYRGWPTYSFNIHWELTHSLNSSFCEFNVMDVFCSPFEVHAIKSLAVFKTLLHDNDKELNQTSICCHTSFL